MASIYRLFWWTGGNDATSSHTTQKEVVAAAGKMVRSSGTSKVPRPPDNRRPSYETQAAACNMRSTVSNSIYVKRGGETLTTTSSSSSSSFHQSHQRSLQVDMDEDDDYNSYNRRQRSISSSQAQAVTTRANPRYNFTVGMYHEPHAAQPPHLSTRSRDPEAVAHTAQAPSSSTYASFSSSSSSQRSRGEPFQLSSSSASTSTSRGNVSLPAISAAAATGSKLCCDRCDGKHLTDDCPHYRKNRDAHPDAQKNFYKKLGGTSMLPGQTLSRSTRVIRQPGDGSCLFHSMSNGLDGGGAARLRAEICEFIRNNPSHKICDVDLFEWIKWDSGGSCAQYASKMSRGSWGGGIEMAVVSHIKGVNVHVYQSTSFGLAGYKRISAFDHPVRTTA